MKEPQTVAQRPSSFRKKCNLILITLIMSAAALYFVQSVLSGSPPEKGSASKQQTRTIRLAFPELAETYLYRLAKLIYTEAFARLGYGIELHLFPSERSLLESNSGRMDGEAGRILFDSALAANYPNLIRVSESAASIAIGAYTADTAIRFNSEKDLVGRNLIIGYRRGIKLSEKVLFGQVDADHLFEVTDIRQGFRMLKRGRINVMIGIQTSVEGVLAEAEFMDSGIALASILKVFPVYPYLHEKHHSLVPQLASILRSIKKDGTYDRLVREAKSTTKPSVNEQ